MNETPPKQFGILTSLDHFWVNQAQKRFLT